MTDKEYLVYVLGLQALDKDQIDTINKHHKEVEDFLRESFAHTPEIEYGGSIAKGTMISSRYDLDIPVYFPSEEEASVEEIFNTVRDKISEKYTVEVKTSAIRIVNKKNVDNPDYHIDVVPGKYINNDSDDVYIYLNDNNKDKKRQKTNLTTHISFIKESGCVPEIRLTKLWDHLNHLKIRTFILELLVIKVLSKRSGSIEERFRFLLEHLRDEVKNISIEDPANPYGNDLSEKFDDNVKDKISQSAKETLEILEKKGWERIFGSVPTPRRYSIGDCSHELPVTAKWPRVQIRYSVKISCQAFLDHRLFARLESGAAIVPSGLELLFQASTNTEGTHKIFWQVVNTGKHAESQREKGKRGSFFKGKDLYNEELKDQSNNWEYTEYSGTHWIQCVVIQEGVCVGKSERFYVLVFNSKYNLA